MSCLLKIKYCEFFTKTEEGIASYIVEHAQEVMYDTAQVCSIKMDTSPAALIRFSKKLGYQGFTELKMDLAKDVGQNANGFEFNELLDEYDTLDMMINKAKNSDLTTIQETYDVIHKDSLEKATQSLKEANKIYLFGIGASALSCSDLAQKLSRVGANVIYYTDAHMQLATSTFIEENDVALAISYSGKSKEVLLAMNHAKEVGAKTIAITQINKSALSKFADILLYVPKQEEDLRLGAVASRNASLILTDLLYLGFIKDHIGSYKVKLKKTRELVKKLQE